MFCKALILSIGFILTMSIPAFCGTGESEPAGGDCPCAKGTIELSMDDAIFVTADDDSPSHVYWTFDLTSGDCTLSNGKLKLYSDGDWTFNADAYSTDSGDEWEITWTFKDSAGNRMFSLSSHCDIKYARQWRDWSDSGSYSSSYYNRLSTVSYRYDC